MLPPSTARDAISSAKARAVLGDALREDALFVREHGCGHGACANDASIFPVQRGKRHGQHGEIGRNVALRQVHDPPRCLRHDHLGEDVARRARQRRKICQRHLARVVQRDPRIQRKEQSQHIGKAEPAPQAAAERRAVAELHADDVLDRFLHGALREFCESLVQLERAQRHHRADAVFGIGFLNFVQSQIAQVDRRADLPLVHLEPQHAAQHHIIFLLTKRVSLVQTLRPYILIDRKHLSHPSVLSFRLLPCKRLLTFGCFPASGTWSLPYNFRSLCSHYIISGRFSKAVSTIFPQKPLFYFARLTLVRNRTIL